MARPTDAFLKSDEFKTCLAEADAYSAANDLDHWATRVAWVGLSCGVDVARRFAQRRSNYVTSQAWSCYTRLVVERVFSEDPEGVFYTKTSKWERRRGPLNWFDTLTRIAAGEQVPKDFPRGQASRARGVA